ncbi:MAG: LacI family DNA-binding transcriptional regulator [Rhodobacteraceae bacterium]|nr:LacI family DNA-binding transcriptional regulator [Paracoccaceae bacterium]
MTLVDKKPGRSVTMKDVAREVGVSSATVSYVLNGLGKVSPEVDERVRQAAQKLGYTRNLAATALKTGRHNVIGCIVPTLMSPVLPQIMRAIHDRARELGFATFVVESETGGEAEAVQVLANHGVDGAIAILEARPEITDAPLFPIVVLDREVAGLDSVLCDHFRGGLLVAQHALALGHRRIGLLSGNPEMESSRLRREGVVQGLKGQADIVWEVEVPLAPELPADALAALATRKATFVASVNDTVAMGALNGLRSLGIAVPYDVSVMGFDDIAWSSWPVFDLSTINQPLDEMGRQAVDLLAVRLGQPEQPARNVVLPVNLIPRGSTRTPGGP